MKFVHRDIHTKYFFLALHSMPEYWMIYTTWLSPRASSWCGAPSRTCSAPPPAPPSRPPAAASDPCLQNRRAVQNQGFGSGIRIGYRFYQVSGSGFGIRIRFRIQWPAKIGKKLRNFMFLKCWMFSFWGLKAYSIFHLSIFINFWSSKPWIWIGSGSEYLFPQKFRHFLVR